MCSDYIKESGDTHTLGCNFHMCHKRFSARGNPFVAYLQSETGQRNGLVPRQLRACRSGSFCRKKPDDVQPIKSHLKDREWVWICLPNQVFRADDLNAPQNDTAAAPQLYMDELDKWDTSSFQWEDLTVQMYRSGKTIESWLHTTGRESLLKLSTEL